MITMKLFCDNSVWCVEIKINCLEGWGWRGIGTKFSRIQPCSGLHLGIYFHEVNGTSGSRVLTWSLNHILFLISSSEYHPVIGYCMKLMPWHNVECTSHFSREKGGICCRKLYYETYLKFPAFLRSSFECPLNPTANSKVWPKSYGIARFYGFWIYKKVELCYLKDWMHDSLLQQLL